ncbi:MAG TPA: hypothetical protein VNC78_06145 [Actinomycetota bacterium]|nr:hypothetical protein [Actinomycetota bacterium]
MSRTCTVCLSVRRADADRMLTTSTVSLRQISTSTGLSVSALFRHRSEGHVDVDAQTAARLRSKVDNLLEANDTAEGPPVLCGFAEAVLEIAMDELAPVPAVADRVARRLRALADPKPALLDAAQALREEANVVKEMCECPGMVSPTDTARNYQHA